MVKNIITTALRVFWKERGYSLLNISGLTVGIATSLMLFLYIQDEKSVNLFHKDVDRIYQVMEHQRYSGGYVLTTTANPGPLKDAFKAEMPEVEYITQLVWEEERLFIVNDQSYKSRGRVASEDFFHVFDFPFIEGSQQNSLTAPDVVYISESLAERIFKTTAVLDKMVQVNGWGEYKIGGVFKDPPINSTLDFEFVLPIEPWLRNNEWLENWGNNGIRDYIKLHEGVDAQAFNAKIKDYVKTKNEGSVVDLFIQNIGEQYLHGRYKDGVQAGGRITYVRLFGYVAIFILVIACINFMNLATARSSKRAKEVGVKKAVGSTRGQLIAQFMGESIIMALASTLLAGLVIMYLLPSLNDFTGKAMTFSLLNLNNLLLLVGIALVVGVLAGSYPSLFLSSFSPIKVLRGSFRSSGWSNGIRKGLVVFQFLISIFLIISTLAVHKQISYVKNINLGYNKESIIYLPLEGELQNESKIELFKAKMLENPNILNVSTASNSPINIGSSTSGGFSWEGKDPESEVLFTVLQVSTDFIETLGMEMKEGRSFDPNLVSDTLNVIINEQTAKNMNVDNPLNQPITFWDRQGKVVGIVKDFHFASLHNKIDPLVISLRPESSNVMFLKTTTANTKTTLDYVEKVFKEVNGQYPFEYQFLDEQYENLYRRESDIGTLANIFTLIAVFISLLGLFGLASFAAEQRIKEIGIRKVLGAGIGNLIMLLAKNFLLLVLLGFGIAVPLSYFFLSDFLSAFEYQATIGVGVYIIAGFASVIIALLTVSYHSFRAAAANPVKSLKYE
ncbi:ABC-type antimicrobial peptide transport system permease subunit [Roseivirga ehrenbergii]|uniref:ABC transporter permease n=1 Tax=Roseivirga ehrenbergii (strain DSM 102268 / JCM 13514 / KCTC 12282 / NCIMB 14502 / KMM 6017) TaxID=279360 RepID=A0A150XSK1_ROSEK|nr:ABC transporter permease [Roseivirga ehrenbergii]KYG81720.1 hypothetical protein MB14_14170 [Roseivirga ehrenbergii]TCL10898.1 ABC-type antimicrobial peptide transport system permease subunit [Roseivirga ehrenbergii]